MSKYWSKEEKLLLLKEVEGLGCITAAKQLNIAKNTVVRWRRELRVLGEEGLNPGNGSQSKKIRRKGRPKSLNFHDMTKEELIEYIEVMNDIKKYSVKSIKKRYFTILRLKKKYQISHLCYLLRVSKSGYYKWLKWNE